MHNDPNRARRYFNAALKLNPADKQAGTVPYQCPTCGNCLLTESILVFDFDL